MQLKAIKIFFVGLILIFLVHCRTQVVDIGPIEDQKVFSEVVFDATEVKIGDMIKDLVISELSVNKLDENDYFAIVFFNGELILTGELIVYEIEDISEGWGLGNIFQPNEESAKRIPVLNYEIDRNVFTIEDNLENSLKSLTNGRYLAKIKVRDYEIWSAGKAQENKAYLIEILNYELIEQTQTNND